MKGLGDNCGGSSSDHWGSSVAVEPGVSVVPSEGGGDVSGHGGGVVRDGNGDLLDGVDGGVDSLADGLDGVGPGLVSDGLGDGLVGPHWSGDMLGAEGWDVLEDGLSDVVGPDDGGWLVGGDGSGNVSVGGLSDWVSQSGDLGSDLSEGMSLSGGVSKVTAQPVVLDGGGVVSRSSDQVRGGSQGSSGSHHGLGGHFDDASTAKSDQGGEKQEGLKLWNDE